MSDEQTTCMCGADIRRHGKGWRHVETNSKWCYEEERGMDPEPRRRGIPMIPVDLNRLREARDDMPLNPDAEHFPVPFVELVDAVLDAPTVYWCSFQDARMYLSCDGLREEVKQAEDHSGCGFVNLVPVKGEN